MNLEELITNAQLPSSLDIITKLQQCIASGVSSATDLAQKLQTDAGLTARVLQIANSAFYGRGSIENVEDAVVLLGENDLIALIISTEVIKSFKKVPYFDMNEFWCQNVFTATSAKIIARRTQADKGRAFTATLLRKVGQLVLCKSAPEIFAGILEQQRTSDTLHIHQAEQSTLGYDHAVISSSLLRKWSIPDTITIPIYYYLDPAKADSDSQLYAAIIYLATQHTCEHFGMPVPDWVSEDWLTSTLSVSKDALIAEASSEIQIHYERTLTTILS